MAERRPVVPRSDAGFNRRFKLITQVTGQKTAGSPPEWTHIPQNKVNSLIDGYAAWFTAYAPILVPHSSVEIAEKNRVRGETEPPLREFIQRYLYVSEVTATDLAGMELPAHDGTWTPHDTPAEHVELFAYPNAPGEIRLDFSCLETGKRGRPDETYYGMVLYVEELEEGQAVPPVESFEHSQLLTRSPFIIRFSSDKRGKRVAFSGCWENGRGHEGPRCPAVIAYIP
jgi:hypothetical protein